ncbi:hypothetical protein BGZ60DRAFT_437696 [Tricladium varicosporioides]|nr:hypothetical protein BGZ60DRAFT_437696 [Hymenoscyphus varicosporioides]
MVFLSSFSLIMISVQYSRAEVAMPSCISCKANCFRKNYTYITPELASCESDPWRSETGPTKYIPFSWTVWPNATNAANTKCPSRSQILGIFAITNIFVAICSILLGHRLVTKKLTCGLLGHRESSSYSYLWLPSFGLQLGANAIIAALIKKYPGYESGFSIAELTFFLCVRPRMNWLIALGAMQYDRLKKRADETKCTKSQVENEQTLRIGVVDSSTSQELLKRQNLSSGSKPSSQMHPESPFGPMLNYLSKALPDLPAQEDMSSHSQHLPRNSITTKRTNYDNDTQIREMPHLTSELNFKYPPKSALKNSARGRVLDVDLAKREEDHCYYSSAMTVILSELLLQLFAAYTMGRTCYCPPNLAAQAALWVAAGAGGSFLGTGF